MSNGIRRSAQQWQRFIDRQAKSGLSALQFCADEELSYPVFRKWRKKLSAQQPVAPAALIKLPDLEMAQRQTGWDIELELGDGHHPTSET